MPRSRIISAAALKPLIAYAAIAFVLVLVFGELLPTGPARRALIVGWIVLFPFGGWWVLHRARSR